MLLIQKAKLVGGNLQLSVKRQDGKGPQRAAAESYDTPVHADLEAELGNLRFHYGCLLGIVNGKKTDPRKVKPEMLEEFRVSGYFYKGKNSESIGLTGMIKQANGKWTAATVSAVAIEPAAEDEGYMHMDALMETVKALDAEINSYLSGDKIGFAKQGALDLPDANDDDETTEGE